MNVNRIITRLLVILALLPSGLAAASIAGGCGDDLSESGTSGRRIVLETRVEAGDDLDHPLLNAQGWSIQLTRVLLSTGPMYYYDGAPPSLARVRSWKAWFTVPNAFAHPGHYQSGNAMGQQLEPASFDLLLGPVSLSAGEGITGSYRSAALTFQSPALGAEATSLGSNLILVEGEATRDGESRRFRASASSSDMTNPAGRLAVEGCVFEEAEVDGNGTVVMRVSPSVWLDQVDFSGVPVSDNDFVDLPIGGPAHQAFTLLGVTRASAYRFAYERP